MTHKYLTVFSALILIFTLIHINPKVEIVNQSSLGFLYKISGEYNPLTKTNAVRSAMLATANSADLYDSLVFTGDVLLARNVEVLMTRFGEAYPFDGVNFSKFGERTAVIGNFESAIPVEHNPTPAFSLAFSTKQDYVTVLEQVGFTHASIANNHSTDFGIEGLVSTIHNLTKGGLKVFGHKAGLDYDSTPVIETKYGTIALVGLDDSAGGLKEREISNALDAAKKKSDMQIVYIHWGIEYDLESSPRQLFLAEKLIKHGADLIVGHHPHVVQEIDLVDGVPVVYSLGNFIFDQYFSVEVQEGLTLQLEFEPYMRLVLLPTESMTNISQPTEMIGDRKAEFLYELSKRSDMELQNAIKQGFVPLHSRFASSSKIAMITK